MFNLEINDLDKKIWEQELNDFVPEKVYDVHTHIYQWQSNLDKIKIQVLINIKEKIF